MDSIYALGIVVQAIDKLTGPARKMAGAIANLEKTAERANKMIAFGNQVGLSGALVSEAAQRMRGALMDVFGPLQRLQDAQAPLKTVITSTMGSVEKSMQAATAAALDWSKKHRNAADEFINTAYIMAGAGLNDVQAIEGTRVALAVATATMGDATEAANLLAVVYNNMGNKAADVRAEMTRLGDVITATQGVFQIANMAQLSEGLKYAIPTALQARMSFEQLSTIIGQLNNAGLQGSMAGTAFAATMRQMTKASAELGFKVARTKDGGVDFIATLENIKKKYGDLSKLSPKVQMAFQQAFGDEGLRAVVLLSNQTDVMRKNLEAVTKSMGVTTKAQEMMEATASAQMQILMNNLDALKMDLATNLLPLINKGIPLVRQLFDAFAEFTKAHPALAQTGVLLFGVGTAVLFILGPILSVASGFIMMMGYGLKAAVAVGRGVKWMGAQLGAAVRGVRALGTGVANLARQAFLAATRALAPLVASVWSFTAALLANPITWIVLGVIALGAAIYLLVRHWDAVTAAARRFFGWLQGVLQGVPDVLLAAFPILLIVKYWDQIRGAAGQAWLAIRTGAAQAREWIVGQITAIVDWIRGLPAQFAQSGAALWDAFTNGIRSVLNKPLEVVRSGLARIRNLLPFSDAKEGPLSTLTKSGAALMDTFASGVRNAVPRLERTLAQGLQVAAPPVLQPAVAGGAPSPLRVQVDTPDLSGFLPPRAEARPAAARTQRPIVIQGGVTIQVQKLDRPEDLLEALRRLASEVATE